MPVKGFSSITVKDEVKQKLEKLADKNHESLADAIQRLLDLEA